MKQLLYITTVMLLAVCCKKKPATESTRSFYMGVTPWPADFTAQEVDTAYQFINSNCDLVAHHFDEGIPWEEAYNNSNWPAALLADIATRKNKTTAAVKIFLSSSALDLTRKQKAVYYPQSTGIAQQVKQQWEQLPFNDAKVVTAYVNYLQFLIRELQPAFINYAVESNVDTWDVAAFQLYKDFVSKVYTQLKSSHPTIPVLLSIITNETPASFAFAQQLMPYTDYVALSSYPYTHVSSSANGNTNPALFPSAYFGSYLNLAPSKPFGFAETGYIAEDLQLPAYNLNKQGNKQWQQSYLETIANITNNRKGKFLIWFCSKDYDQGNNTLRSLGLYTDLFSFWEDTGLRDENGNARPAYTSWQSWMKRKRID